MSFSNRICWIWQPTIMKNVVKRYIKSCWIKRRKKKCNKPEKGYFIYCLLWRFWKFKIKTVLSNLYCRRQFIFAALSKTLFIILNNVVFATVIFDHMSFAFCFSIAKIPHRIFMHFFDYGNAVIIILIKILYLNNVITSIFTNLLSIFLGIIWNYATFQINSIFYYKRTIQILIHRIFRDLEWVTKQRELHNVK